MSQRVAFAIAAHPDDIEFLMAGTLLRLKEVGFEIHYMNISSGSLGSLEHPADTLREIRREEAKQAAKILGATFHPSIADDIEILYRVEALRELCATIREVAPDILLVPSPQDYMEDHTNACRLAVSAAFARGMPNFETLPPTPPIQKDVCVYHALPHGLRDGLRQRIRPGAYVDTTSVHAQKAEALAAHKSQQSWLDESQNMNAYLKTQDDFSKEIGKLSGTFEHAEGWRRRLHYGFCDESADPLAKALGDAHRVDQEYERRLETL